MSAGFGKSLKTWIGNLISSLLMAIQASRAVNMLSVNNPEKAL